MVSLIRVEDVGKEVLLVDARVSTLPAVNVAPPGHTIAFSWNAVAGATSVEVTSAEAEIGSAVVEEVLGDLSVGGTGSDRTITIPGGKRIRRLTLQDLKAADGTILQSEPALRAKSLRLVVTLPDGAGGWTPPLYSVPPVPRRNLIPASLTGATFSSGTLNLPDVAAAQIRLTLVTKDFPEDFVSEPSWSLGRVTGVAALPSKDLQLIGADNAVVWAFPGELPPESPSVPVDLRFALEQAFGTAISNGAAPNTTFRLQGASPTRAGLSVDTARGAIVRAFPGVLRAELAGDRAALQLQGPPLAAEQPSSVMADVTVRYEGVRILESVSDAVPAAAGGVNGTVVAGQALVRALPPALQPPPIARVGIIGRAPVDSELSVEIVDMSLGRAGAALGRPGVVQVPASETVATVWVEMPEAVLPKVPLGVSVRANKGRFLWAAAEAPLLRLAVRDPDPGGRTLRLGSQTLVNIDGERLEMPAQALPAAVFRSQTPAFESDLFLTIDVADLTLRYAR